VLSGLLQPSHLVALLLLALIFLGPKRLPDAGRAIGQGLREFKHSIGGVHAGEEQIAAHANSTREDKPPSE
jgi:sec-independent protein translocase protein TatA